MPRYFFHLRDGVDKPDLEGTELPDLSAVRAEAIRSTGEAIRDLREEFWSSKAWELYVTDVNRKHVLTVTIAGTMGTAYE